MAIESAADRAVFVAAADFGATAQYKPVGGSFGDDIAGIFSKPSIEIALDQVSALDVKPTFFCADVDLPGAADGDAGDNLRVDGITYLVTALKPDGTGMTLIVLGKP